MAVTAGVMAGLVSLVGFGTDSGIGVDLRGASGVAAGRPAPSRRAGRGQGAPGVAAGGRDVLPAGRLCRGGGARGLLGGEESDTSTVGLVLLGLSVIVMPLLAHAKRRVGVALGGDRLIQADAAETRICVLLSVSTLLGLGLFAVTGAAWLDPVAGFVIAGFAVKEGMEAWEGELVEDDDE